MGTDDVITWAPRLGSTGDDRYDPGEMDIAAGTISTLHDPPRVSDVHLGTHINQIIMECFRRLGDDAGLPSYQSAGALVTGSWESALRDAIDDIRTADGSGAYSWPTALESGKPIRRENILALRKALVTDVLPYRKALSYSVWKATGSSYYPSTRAAGGSAFLGQYGLTTTNYQCYRTIMYYNGLPNNTVKDAILRLTVGSWARDYDRSWNIAVRQCEKIDTVDSDSAWDFTDLGEIGLEAPPTSGNPRTIDIDLDASGIDPESDFWVVLSSDRDFDADQPGTGASGGEYATFYTLSAYLVANNWVGD
jgi:hypothetical protein